ncbi:MAG: ABC transporter substrate-binding protein [Streptosporangiales bacterium]|nr:ABC transporter substrate-binding protein [Streptosporangiales bacterium]
MSGCTSGQEPQEILDAPDAPPEEAGFYADLARRLREAHRRAAALDEDVRIPVIRRLLIITEAVKRDPERASGRLDQMLAELESGAFDPPTR